MRIQYCVINNVTHVAHIPNMVKYFVTDVFMAHILYFNCDNIILLT